MLTTPHSNKDKVFVVNFLSPVSKLYQATRCPKTGSIMYNEVASHVTMNRSLWKINPEYSCSILYWSFISVCYLYVLQKPTGLKCLKFTWYISSVDSNGIEKRIPLILLCVVKIEDAIESHQFIYHYIKPLTNLSKSIVLMTSIGLRIDDRYRKQV